MSKLSVIAVSALMEKFKDEAVKDTWRLTYRLLRQKRDDETALVFVQLHAKETVCQACGCIELPKVELKEMDGGKFHIKATCSGCGGYLKFLGYELKKVWGVK